jgi:hypothetical protein
MRRKIMDRMGHRQTRRRLYFVEELPLEDSRQVHRSQPIPEMVVDEQSREWFWCRRVVRLKLDELPDGTQEIRAEFRYCEALGGGSSKIFTEQTDGEANPEAR